MTNKLKNILIIFVIAILTISCGSSNEAPGKPGETSSSETQPTLLPEPTDIPEPTSTPRPLWNLSSSIDEMTEETSYFTISPNVSPTKLMGSPYDDVEAWIGVGCNESGEWMFIGFTTSPNLVNTDTEDGYDRISTRLKWDDTIETETFYQNWGDRFLNPLLDDEIISKLETHEILLLELEWYGEGNVYFKFPLAGAVEGIKTIRTNCTP